MPHDRCHWQSPSNPTQMAASFTSAHCWQQTDGTSWHDPLVDSWIERPCCGNSMCVYTTMDWNSTANDLLAVNLQLDAGL
ncbi:hypothetical protein ACRRTK_008108 [Alexandromys fortis]